jgi:hypothetical protein
VTEALKEGPFCGGDARISSEPQNMGQGMNLQCWSVGCAACGARTKDFVEYGDTPDECRRKAVAAWNMRTRP